MRYLLIVIIFIIGFSALPVWAMDCYAEHEGGKYRSHWLRTKNFYPQ